MNGAGIPSAATDTIPVVAVGTTAPAAARWASRTGTTPIAPASTWASVLSAQQASKKRDVAVQYRCSAGGKP